MEYGSLFARGYEASDAVCFTSDESHCAYNFKFFAITYQDGGLFDFEDGIIGMSTHKNDYVTGPLLIAELYDQKKIQKPRFAFYLSGEQDTSYIDIGEFHYSSLKNRDNFIEMDVLPGSFFWS